MSGDSPEIVEAGLSGSRQDKKKVQDEQRALVGRLVEAAQAEGRELVGRDGMLAGLVKLVLETALQAEMDAHLGRGHGEITDPGEVVNHRNGNRTKTVMTDVGPVEIEVPRDRNAGFEPRIVRKRQRRLGGVDDMLLSLSAKGLTHGEISAHLAEIYGTEVSKATIMAIADRVLDGMTEWQNRPLDAVHAVLFIDAVHVKVRDGKVANRPIYLVIGGDRRWIPGDSRPLGRRRRRGRQVMGARPDRTQEPRRPGRAHDRLRRAQGPARGHQRHLAADRRANMHRPPAAQHVPIRAPPVLAQARRSSQTRLHRPDRSRCLGALV